MGLFGGIKVKRAFVGAFLGNQSGKRDHQEVNCNLPTPLAQESNTHVLRAKELD